MQQCARAIMGLGALLQQPLSPQRQRQQQQRWQRQRPQQQQQWPNRVPTRPLRPALIDNDGALKDSPKKRKAEVNSSSRPGATAKPARVALTGRPKGGAAPTHPASVCTQREGLGVGYAADHDPFAQPTYYYPPGKIQIYSM
jgi:hypothetical protein